MRKIILYLCLCFAFLLSNVSCKKQIIQIIAGKITNAKTKQPIQGAKVRINNDEATTDKEGNYKILLDMEENIYNKYSRQIDAPKYQSSDEMITVAIKRDDGRQDAYDKALNPISQISYNPDPVVLYANESATTLQIFNSGVNPVDFTVSKSATWIGLANTSGTIQPTQPFNLAITPDIGTQSCKITGYIIVTWANDNTEQQSDTINITKFIKDNTPPTAVLWYDTLRTLQHRNVHFSAKSSSDNCTAHSDLMYKWSFEDSLHFSSAWLSTDSISHVFSTTGVKNIFLKVKDEQNNITRVQQSITILQAPTCPIFGNDITTVAGSLLLTARLDCSISDFGGTFAGLIDHGFVYSTVYPLPNIWLNNGQVSLGAMNSLGNMSTTITNLEPNKKYYISAYATNGNCTFYSNVVEYIPSAVDFVPIQAGLYFQMGSNSSFSDQAPQHTIQLNPFKLSRTEVTNLQFATFLNAIQASQTLTDTYINQNDVSCKIEYTGTFWRSKIGFESYPVVTVTWSAANAFCQWAGGRLPTEAEWECAARGDNHGANPSYSGFIFSNSASWYSGNSGNSIQMVANGQHNPNGYGLHDMSGNALEWCSDWYEPNYYTSCLPPNNVNPQGPALSSLGQKVVRGGAFDEAEDHVADSFRHHYAPTVRVYNIGFRCAKSN